MGKFGDYAGNKVEVDIDDEIYKLEVKAKDKGKLLSEQNKDNTDFSKLIEILQNIFVKSYPDEDDEKIKNWVTQKAETILMQLHVAWGNLSQEQVDKIKKGDLPQELA